MDTPWSEETERLSMKDSKQNKLKECLVIISLPCAHDTYEVYTIEHSAAW